MEIYMAEFLPEVSRVFLENILEKIKTEFHHQHQKSWVQILSQFYVIFYLHYSSLVKSFLLLLFYFIFKLYNILLVLPNIEMYPPQYTCVPHPEPSSLLLPHTLPLGRPSAPAPSIQFRASNLDWRLVSNMILYMFQCHSPKSSHPIPLSQSP